MRTLAQRQNQPEKPESSDFDQSHPAAPGPHYGPDIILHLQRTVGNRAVQQFLQTKLAINKPGDEYEQEANRIADQVTATPAQTVASSESPRIQRSAGQPASQTETTAPASVDQALSSPGKPLEPALQQDMEQRFGYDFSHVRVHSGTAADQSAQDISATAYTVGPDIVFGADRFTPGTHEGQRLIVHELTHVVQQSRAKGISAGDSAGKRGLSPISSLSEPLHGLHAAQGTPGLALQRKPDDKPVSPKPPKATPPKPIPQKGLSRTLYVINNDIWNWLPTAVRTSAETELKSLFAFVGAAKGEKPFSIKVATAAQLPEQFDFSESVVSVIRGDPDTYVKDAFARQNEQIRSWLAQQRVQRPMEKAGDREPLTPEQIGSGGGSRGVITEQGKTYALLVMAGAVDIGEVINSFFDNIENLLEEQLTALPEKGRNPTKWPATVKSKGGTTSWQPQELLGVALGRAIAHEARHEYIGASHAETGLGQDSPFIIGEKTTATFSEKDQKAILAQIHKLETTQGKATVVPTFPQSMRQKPKQFPF
jgi:hypothetical protein